MNVFRSIDEVRQWRKNCTRTALVPTMGNLHDGHLALVKAAKSAADHVIVSIFVNRLQFGQGEDFGAYPRTLTADIAKLEAAGVDAVFAPDDKELYPRTIQDYNVEPPGLQNELCGRFRPGHFRGVATVVLKLFNIVKPDIACFGKKDFQQLVIIRNMAQDLNLDIEIIPVDIGRAADGLALSSRNAYLSEAERAQAPQLYHTLQEIAARIAAGETDFAVLEQNAAEKLRNNGWQVDYVAVCRPADLQPARSGDAPLIVLAAARLGNTRLIDNLEIG